MWMEFIVKRAVRSVTATNASTLFPGCVWLPRGFIGCRKFWQAFFKFFPNGFLPGIQISEAGNSGGMEGRNAQSIRVESDNVVTIPCPQYGVEIKSSAYLFPRASRLKSRWARAIFFRE